MASEVEPRSVGSPTTADSPADADVLSFGPRSPDRRQRRGLLLLLVLVVLAAGGYGAWQLRPRAAPDFSLADLEGVYAGMVRSDGTNDVSLLDREQMKDPVPPISRAECAPLFEFTLANQYPATAAEGVATYWLDPGSAVSLMTFRYPTADAAAAEFERVETALQACTDGTLTVDRTAGVRIVEQTLPAATGVQGHRSYEVDYPVRDVRYQTEVLRLTNTVTWLYRYDYGPQAASPVEGSQQLMTSMIQQMQAIQDTHR
jgi:hypothetical protein